MFFLDFSPSSFSFFLLSVCLFSSCITFSSPFAVFSPIFFIFLSLLLFSPSLHFLRSQADIIICRTHLSFLNWVAWGASGGLWAETKVRRRSEAREMRRGTQTVCVSTSCLTLPNSLLVAASKSTHNYTLKIDFHPPYMPFKQNYLSQEVLANWDLRFSVENIDCNLLGRDAARVSTHWRNVELPSSGLNWRWIRYIFFQELVTTYRSTRRHNPENHNW